jgi:hypothetical protein
LNILRKKIKKSPKKSPLWKRYSFLFSGRVGLAMSWFSRPSLLLFLYGVPSLGLALAILSLYSRLASRQGCGSLLTCLLVKSSPMAEVENIRFGVALCSHLVDSRAQFPLCAAQLVCSQQFVSLPELLTYFHSFYFTRDLVPTVNHS